MLTHQAFVNLRRDVISLAADQVACLLVTFLISNIIKFLLPLHSRLLGVQPDQQHFTVFEHKGERVPILICRKFNGCELVSNDPLVKVLHVVDFQFTLQTNVNTS